MADTNLEPKSKCIEEKVEDNILNVQEDISNDNVKIHWLNGEFSREFIHNNKRAKH
jgi:hypothetical protein